MSEQAGVEGTPTEPEHVFLEGSPASAFAQLMDVLAPEADAAGAGEGGATTDAAAPADGSSAPAAQGTGAAGGAPAAPATGADGKPAAQGAPAAADAADVSGVADPGGAGRPVEWTAAAADLIPKFGEMSTALEDKVARAHHEEALEATRTDHKLYFEVLEEHPRALIGREVPKLGGEEGEMETLRDAADAREWQEQLKTMLVAEVRDRAGRALEESGDYLATLHQSIEMFQNNKDLIPGTKEFDVELANRVTAMLEPYELRVDEKLHGYSIKAQPLIDGVRKDLAASRSSGKSEAGAAGGPTQPPAAPADGPQAGISSKSGTSSDDESAQFQSALFGTLGLPDMRI